jgi:F0F1-type ATP synthase membrane subunit b/b'
MASKTCPFCKEDIRENATKCRYCQSSLASDAQPEKSSDDRRVTYILDQDLIRFAKFAIAILAIFVVVGMYLFGFKMEHMVERLSETQKNLELAQKEMTSAKQDLQAAQTTVNALKSEVQRVLKDATDELGKISTHEKTAQKMVISITQLNQDQSARLEQIKQQQPDKFRDPETNSKLWPVGAKIRIRFLDGSEKLQARVMEAAKGWTKYANLSFEQSTSFESEVRVSFKTDSSSWSYIGTDAIGKSKEEPTMQFGWLTDDSSDEEVRENVLHEFGHAIGLIHEHQNPNAVNLWNRKTVLKYFSGPPNYWSKKQIEENILSPAEIDNYREFDPKSIMMYLFPGELFTSGIGTGVNRELSKSDKEFIAKLYPGRKL